MLAPAIRFLLVVAACGGLAWVAFANGTPSSVSLPVEASVVEAAVEPAVAQAPEPIPSATPRPAHGTSPYWPASSGRGLAPVAVSFGHGRLESLTPEWFEAPAAGRFMRHVPRKPLVPHARQGWGRAVLIPGPPEFAIERNGGYYVGAWWLDRYSIRAIKDGFRLPQPWD